MYYFFNLGSGRLPRGAKRAARKHGAEAVEIHEQCKCGRGHNYGKCPKSVRHYFQTANHGEPHNSRVAAAVSQELSL